MTNPTEFLKKSIKQNNRSILNSKLDKKPKFPCGVCNCEVKHNHKAIECSKCMKYAHIVCTGISDEEYRDLQLRNRDNPELIETEIWICIKCDMEERSEYNPFIFLSDNQLTNMNSVDSMHLFDMFPDDDVITNALKTNYLNTNGDNDEIDESNVENINCRYYTCEEFFNHDNSNSLNILHSNVNGFLGHADNINEFITHHKKTDFDAICITETSLKKMSTFQKIQYPLVLNHLQQKH